MKALVVVDYQNDLVSGELGNKYTMMIENNICKRIESTLKSDGDVFFTVDAHDDNYPDTLEGKMQPIRHCIEGTEGFELYGKVKDYQSLGFMIRKKTFGSNELMERLRKYDEIEICGVHTDVSVLANAVIARTANPEAHVIVRQNCVATRDAQMGEEAFDIMNALQIEII